MSDHSRFSAFTNDCLGNADATEISLRIKKREISVGEACRAAMQRAERSQSILGAVACTVQPELGARSDPQSSSIGFHGVPAYLKDNIDLAGYPTKFGSRAMPLKPKVVSSPLTNHLEATGLIFIGKSTTPPFGFGCSTEFEDDTPPTRNPWHLDYSAGGSSGGSCALVASGVVAIAHANDGGGSIRIPAAMCGVVGLKPSRGRLVANESARRMPVNIISDGVVTRSVRDTAFFYAASEKLYQAPGLKPIGHVEGPSIKRRRIGVVFDSVFTKADEETRETLLSTASALEKAGHTVEQMAVPAADQFGDDFELYWSLLAFSIEYFGTSVFGRDFDKRKLDPLTLGLSKQFRQRFWKAPLAIRRLKQTGFQSLKSKDQFDMVLSPVIAKVTPRLGVLNPGVPFHEIMPQLKSYVGYTPVANAAGTPAISLPMGTSRLGLPIGVQLSASLGDEKMLLELAYELEAARPWKQLYSAPTL